MFKESINYVKVDNSEDTNIGCTDEEEFTIQILIKLEASSYYTSTRT
jgi:hypothetical protein